MGDSYMCAGGIHVANVDHPFQIVKAGLEIREFMKERNKTRVARGLVPLEVRIGVHVGPIVAGVLGTHKYAYDIWGSTVNIASRMESNGAPGEVNISAATYELIKEKFVCRYRGKVNAKNVGGNRYVFCRARDYHTRKQALFGTIHFYMSISMRL